ncbi:DUF3006 family protein [Halopiger goleimassiliensis]|uniref:DUF3006 family protein n=1 Tax=Halopiger goleimassiliensis TaxID=1293048 RepID=UPI0006780CEC|nr:DUF3006 family protein [Halopiger goleimassiliensis]
MTETYTATVDRIVDGETAVLLLEEDGEVAEQLEVEAAALPEPAREDGGVLRVTLEDGAYVDAEYLAAETERRREAVRERYDRLSERLSDSS